MTVVGSSCGKNAMRSGVEVRDRSLQQWPRIAKIHNDVCQCNNCGKCVHHGSNWSRRVLMRVCVFLYGAKAQAFDKLVPQEHCRSL